MGLDAGLRLVLVVMKCLVAEIKAVEQLIPICDAQLLTHLTLTGYRPGLIINFNTSLIKYCIKRIAR